MKAPAQTYFLIITRLWQDFLDSLNSDGGHILILKILTLTGMLGTYYQIPKSEDIFVGSFAALLLVLKTAGSNKTRRDRPEPESTTTVSTTTAGPQPPEVKLDTKKETV